MNSKTFLIFGCSKGLGQAITRRLPSSQDLIFGVSRSKPAYSNLASRFEWICADLSKPIEAIELVSKSIEAAKIDVLIYNVGIWEKDAFTKEYDFFNTGESETISIINTNLVSFLLAVRKFKANLELASNPKIIVIGSTWGLDNHNGREVAFSASKFALRGAVHALRESLKENGIGISVLNIGYMATEYDIDTDLEHVLFETNHTQIPMLDVIEALRFIVNTSDATCVKELNMPAMLDQNM
jgi:short-subunit dehydrogenase